jgi:uncharacterized protein YjdB
MNNQRLAIYASTLLLFSAALACGDDDPDTDAGVDSGVRDSGPADSGPRDVGPGDSGQVTLSTLTVAPTMLTLDVGDTEGLAVTARYTDGRTELITTEGTFTTSAEAVATVNTAGAVTAVGPGSATITVTFGGLSATAMVTVNGGPPPDTFVVFGDDYGNDVSFQEFTGSTNSLAVDTAEFQDGTASLRVTVPAAGYTGGAIVVGTPQDLSDYDALTFWAKSSAAATLNVSGVQNDSAITTYSAERLNVALTTTWTKFTIPLPNPARLTTERGLFHFAEGSDEGAYTIWFDLIQYEKLGAALSNVRPTIPTATLELGVGGAGTVGAPTVIIAADGADVALNASLGSFDFTSSNPAVATVNAAGAIAAVAEGNATITAQLGSVAAAGSVTVNVLAVVPDAPVFTDDYAPNVSFMEFGGSTNALTVDTVEFQEGTASLRVEVPAGGYTGGALAISTPLNVSGYNAVAFWAKASAANPLNVTGLGNDANTSTFQAEFNGVPLTTTWTQFYIPIPDAAVLTSQTGLFHFAEGSEHGAYTIWFDDIRYTTLDATLLTNPRPVMATESVTPQVGSTVRVNGTAVIYNVGGADQVTSAARAYFDYLSSDVGVATVDAVGTVTAVGVGTATITASLASVPAAGALTVSPTPATTPLTPAPVPNLPAANVISLFSDAYTNNPVDTFSAVWDAADVADATVAGDNVKAYTNLDFAGIEFIGTQIDATLMTHFHIDIWNANSTQFRINLVDFGPDGAFGGGDDRNHVLVFDATSTPPLQQQAWQSFDLPLSLFTGLTTRANMAQLVIAGSVASVFVDNIYFHN